MGFYQVGITITGQRSAHNSLQDKLDLAKWEYLAEHIRSMIEREDFESLHITMNGPDE